MAYFSGTVMRGDQVAVDGVSGRLDYVTFPNGGSEWRGEFRLPQGQSAPAGGGYRLVLDDGRSGDIIISRSSIGGHQATAVNFEGSGPLR
jgi:hypothetical protein